MYSPTFELSHQQARLANFNPRAELNGPDSVPAGDLKFEVKMSNDALAMFDPTLKSSLYRRPDPDSEQGERIDDPHHMPTLRFPLMSPFRWDREFAGHELRLHIGFSEASALILQPCKINKFALEPQEGGTVVVSFRVQVHPSTDQAGRLCSLIGTDVDVSVIPLEAGNDGSLLDEAA